MRKITPAQAPYIELPAFMGEPELSNADRLFLLNVVDAVKTAMATGNLGVEKIALGMRLGEQSLRRRIIKTVGQTPKAFFTAIQMDRATRLLAESPNLPVTKIAQMCGFDNICSFGHAFKRIYDCSPSEYRESAAPLT